MSFLKEMILAGAYYTERATSIQRLFKAFLQVGLFLDKPFLGISFQ